MQDLGDPERRRLHHALGAWEARAATAQSELTKAGRLGCLEVCCPRNSTMAQACAELGESYEGMGLWSGVGMAKRSGFHRAQHAI